MSPQNSTASLKKTPAKASKTSTQAKPTVQKPARAPVKKETTEKAPAKPKTKDKAETKAVTKGKKKVTTTTPVARTRKTAPAKRNTTSKPRKAPTRRRKKETGLAESISNALREHIPQIKEALRQTTQSILQNKEALIITFGVVYVLMPPMVRAIATRAEFTNFCLKNAELLIEPSRLKSHT